MQYSGIPITNGFKVTGKGLPIDDRFILTKEDMASTLLPYSKTNPLPYYLPDHYFAICSDDGKLYIYDKINNPPSPETGYFKLLDADNTTKVWQGDKLEGESDADAITRVIASDIPKNGDIIILRTLIFDDKYSYKAFVFNENVWKAMDGNYDADNVYFRENIVAAGNYDKVGNINKGEVIQSAGKSVKDVFQAIFTKELNPVTVQPSVAINTFNGGTFEVGTEIIPEYAISLNPGSYSYDTTTGVAATNYSAVDSLGEIKNTSTGTFNNLVVSDSLNYYVTFSIDHSTGNIPKTNIGNNYPAGQIQAGSKSITSPIISGFRKYFYGSTTNADEIIDSNFIRNLIHSQAKLSDTVTRIENMPVEENARRVVIAIPANAGKELTVVKDMGAYGTNIVDCFEKQIVPVYGENNYAAINYEVFVYSPVVALNQNIYDVTIE